MTTQLISYSYSYNVITGGAPSVPWVYYYVSDVTNSDSNTYYYNWVNPTTANGGVIIPSLYVLVVGEGGIAQTPTGGWPEGGTGGGGGGQVSLFQFNNVQPGDSIYIYYNEASGNSSYCYLNYVRNGYQLNLTEIGAYYYNTPDYATGTDTSTITFSNTLFAPIAQGYLLINNNTYLKIFYGGKGTKGGASESSTSQNGGDGGTGGGGSGGGGGNYAGGTNGSRGTQNSNSGSYGGMKGGTSSSSDCRDGGYTPLCMPDGTGTPLLGNAGNGTDGTGESSDFENPEPGASGSIMVFYPTN